MKIKEKREKRLSLANQCRAMLTKAETEGRDLSAEEKTNYDALWAEMQNLKAQIETEENLAAEEQSLRESQGRQVPAGQGAAPQEPANQTFELRRSVSGQSRTLTLSGRTASREYLSAFGTFLQGQGPSGALQMGSDTGGGYLAPQQFAAGIIQALDNDVFMRQIATVLPPLTTGDSLGMASLDSDPADPVWTSELSTGDEDSDMAFGKRELKPHPLAKRIKVSKTLVRRSSAPVEQMVRDRLAYKFAVVMEYAYLLGSGANQPLGVFTASNNGISTSRDIATGNEATAITADGLIEAKYALKAQYRRSPSLRWLFHRDAVKQVSKLKDGEGNYLWLPSVREGEADRILGVPYAESEYVPNTFTTGQYVGIIGDFKHYHIVDALTLTIQVLTELYAETNQNGYIGRLESDGMPVLQEAFARVKLG